VAVFAPAIYRTRAKSLAYTQKSEAVPHTPYAKEAVPAPMLFRSGTLPEAENMKTVTTGQAGARGSMLPRLTLRPMALLGTNMSALL
jgi:hypothetical protein